MSVFPAPLVSAIIAGIWSFYTMYRIARIILVETRVETRKQRRERKRLAKQLRRDFPRARVL